MPVPTTSRSSAAYTHSISTATPSKYSSQPMSPLSTNSYTPTITSTGQTLKMNVVTRIAIEGKATQGREGASIKMYMKLSIPVNSITPGSTIALFPEENVKILASQVHPLDNNSVPYNFSSSISPLLHNAARALNLQARLPITFSAAHHLTSSPSIASSSPSKSRPPELEDTPISPVDSQYTGQILVSGYHIAYVLPRQFPSQEFARLEDESDRQGHSALRGRRLSFSDRNHAHFMAAVDMWVPYITRPPRHPYLLSIPTPRCLHNNIRLRIFAPSSAAASFASLSSLEDVANTWDLTSDPHVTRTTSNRLARSGSYNHFADDESSDSSTTGFSDGFGIQGSFPSTDRIRIRWAKPMKYFDGGTGGSGTRRRVGVKDVKSEMTCVVKGKGKGSGDDVEGIVMDVEYKASCKGVWFPGVATLLGMDIGLVAKNADVNWIDGSSVEWNVSGGVGYTGFNVAGAGHTNNQPSSRTPSMDSQSPQLAVSPADGVPSLTSRMPSEREDSSSASSLLRAPLPSHHVVEYSFEGSNDETASASSQLGTLSSVSSLTRSTSIIPPGTPLTLHVNINDVLPPNKSPFTFTITGTILITPRPTLARVNGIHDTRSFSDYAEATEPISLPHFTVLAADAEATKTVVRNEISGTYAVVEVYSPSGDIFRDPQARKTVLQQGSSTRCGEGGGRIALKLIGNPHDQTMTSYSRTPNSRPRNPVQPDVVRTPNCINQDRVAPLIHSVKAVVMPLVSRRSPIPRSYAVRIHLNSPASGDTGWLEFGFSRFGPSSSRTPSHNDAKPWSQKVHIAGASVDGVPVQYTTIDTEKQALNHKTLEGPSFETVRSTDWVSWVKVQVGTSTGDVVIVDYIVTVEPARRTWLSTLISRSKWDLLLPTFTLPVTRLEVKLKFTAGFTYSLICSNLQHEHMTSDNQTLLHFGSDDLFSPRVTLELRPTKQATSILWSWFSNGWILPFILVVLLFYRRLDLDPQRVRSSHEDLVHPQNPIHIEEPVTVTVTLASTVTDCLSSFQHPANPTHFPTDSSLPPTGQERSLLATSSVTTLLTPVSFASSETGSTPFSTPDIPRDALSSNLALSLWKNLGFDELLTSLESLELPDVNVSSAKETLARYSRALWEVVEYLLFS